MLSRSVAMAIWSPFQRQVVEDKDRRRAYFDRFVFSQKFAQVDPWSERVSGKDKHEFRPMAVVGYQEAAE